MRLPAFGLLPLLFALLACACSSSGGIQPDSQGRPPTSSFSASSSWSPSSSSTSSLSGGGGGGSSGSSYSPSGPPPPNTLDAQAGAASIVLRPDMIVVPFAVRALADEPETGVGFLEQTLRASIFPRFSELGVVKIKMRGQRVDRVHQTSTKKGVLSKDGPKEGTKEAKEAAESRLLFSIILQGTLEYPLAPSQDYWERARLMAKIDGIREKLMLVHHSDSPSSPLDVNISLPQVAVHDPEASRSELVARWMAKRKQFAREARSNDVAVAVDACRPPAEIVMHPLSLEEIELTLPVDCTRH